MTTPLVSVICLCHNQEKFVQEAISSVLTQTYGHIELIVVDDGSTDGSKQSVRDGIKNTKALFIDLEDNLGNCTAFNKGFSKCTGEYVIDLAADDMLLPNRIEEGIRDFNHSPESGVHFSDAFIMNENGQALRTHYQRGPDGSLQGIVPEGDVYEDLIKTYFICPPTMMVKREVLEHLGGYDETLTYEDFDFWIRSSRYFRYLFNKAPLVKKRMVKKSLGSAQFTFRSLHLQTTYTVCEKAFRLNRSPQEDQALIQRINYEIRQCVKTFNFSLIPKYTRLRKALYRRLSSPSSIDK